MRESVKPDALAAAIQAELSIYRAEVTERVNDTAKKYAGKLKKLTKATDPERSGSYRRHIAIKEESSGHGTRKYVWYVKAPDYRLTHLLVYGHATSNGGRTKSDPFLRDAVDTVLPEFERALKEAVQNDP